MLFLSEDWLAGNLSGPAALRPCHTPATRNNFVNDRATLKPIVDDIVTCGMGFRLVWLMLLRSFAFLLTRIIFWAFLGALRGG